MSLFFACFFLVGALALSLTTLRALCRRRDCVVGLLVATYIVTVFLYYFFFSFIIFFFIREYVYCICTWLIPVCSNFVVAPLLPPLHTSLTQARAQCIFHLALGVTSMFCILHIYKIIQQQTTSREYLSRARIRIGYYYTLVYCTECVVAKYTEAEQRTRH